MRLRRLAGNRVGVAQRGDVPGGIAGQLDSLAQFRQGFRKHPIGFVDLTEVNVPKGEIRIEFEDPPNGSDRLRLTPRPVQPEPHVHRGHQIGGIEGVRVIGLGKAFLDPLKVAQIMPIPLPRRCVAGAKGDGPPKLRFRALPIPFVNLPDHGAGRMGLGAVPIQLHGSLRISFGISQRLRRRNRFKRPATEHGISVGSSSVCWRELRISVYGLGEVSNRLVQSRRSAPVPEVESLKIGLVCGWVDWVGTEEALFLGIELAAQLLRDGFGDLIFQEQDIPRIAFEAVRPEVPVRPRLNQLCRD